MKNLFILFALTFYSLTVQAQHDHVCKDLSSIVQMEQEHGKEVLHFRANPLTQNYDLSYHRLEWTINPNISFIEGTVTSHFTTLEDNFDAVNFDLSHALQILEILYHGATVDYVLTEDDNLKISLPAPLSAGTLDSITVIYEGSPSSTGFGSFATELHGEDIPVQWTLSEPYGAKAWWPCKQDLTDKIDSIDVFVRTPKQYRAASNGLLKSEILEGDEMIYHWQHQYPIPAYLIAIAVTNYVSYSDYVPLSNGESVEVLNYVYPENLVEVQEQTQNIVEIMTLFNNLFGDYPFADEKYGHAQFNWGGGMEHQTMSFMGSFSYNLQAHELAHQWFGDKVTCGSWQDIWLNEAFATYLSGLTIQYLNTAESWYNWKNNVINYITSEPGGSVFVTDTTTVSQIFNGRLSYNKGAMVLHMLRWELGDVAFFQGVNNYLKDPNIAYGYARTSDLQNHLEWASGRDLNEFLEDWYYGEGYPSYAIDWWLTDQGVGFTIYQMTSHESVNFFEMTLPIQFSDGVQDTVLRIPHHEQGETFYVDLPFVPSTLTFDPDRHIISADNLVNLITSTKNLDSPHQSIIISPNPATDQLAINCFEMSRKIRKFVFLILLEM